jgi:hypothetical protein
VLFLGENTQRSARPPSPKQARKEEAEKPWEDPGDCPHSLAASLAKRFAQRLFRAAPPPAPRAIYSEKSGVEALRRKDQAFTTVDSASSRAPRQQLERLRQQRALDAERQDEQADDDAMYEAVSERDPMLSPGGGKGGAAAVRSLRLQPPAPKCNDAFFALLFGAHLVVIAVLALWKGVPAVQKSLRDHQASNPDSKDASLGPALAMAAILAAGAGVLALIWLRVLLAHAESMIRIALWANVAFTVVFALATFAASPFASVLFLALAAVNVCYIYAVRDRIGFASANLKAACAAVQDHGALFVVAIVLLVHQIAWLVLWTLSAIGVNQLFLDANPSCKDNFDVSQGRGQLCGGGGAYVALFFLLISVYWGQQVLQNILTCSTAGVVATWWYQPQAKSVTFGAFYRSMTTSFGSICFGSLLVAILQAMRSVRSQQGIIQCHWFLTDDVCVVT